MAKKAFDTPEAAEAAFYRAFSTIDLDLMATVWSDGDHTLCIHPGSGLLRGKMAVMQSWMEIFTGAEPPIVEYRYIDGYGRKDLTVRLVEERIRARNSPPESSNNVLATNVFLREATSWRLAEHHASLPLVDRSKETGDQRRLH